MWVRWTADTQQQVLCAHGPSAKWKTCGMRVSWMMLIWCVRLFGVYVVCVVSLIRQCEDLRRPQPIRKQTPEHPAQHTTHTLTFLVLVIETKRIPNASNDIIESDAESTINIECGVRRGAGSCLFSLPRRHRQYRIHCSSRVITNMRHGHIFDNHLFISLLCVMDSGRPNSPWDAIFFGCLFPFCGIFAITVRKPSTNNSNIKWSVSMK